MGARRDAGRCREAQEHTGQEGRGKVIRPSGPRKGQRRNPPAGNPGSFALKKQKHLADGSAIEPGLATATAAIFEQQVDQNPDQNTHALHATIRLRT